MERRGRGQALLSAPHRRPISFILLSFLIAQSAIVIADTSVDQNVSAQHHNLLPSIFDVLRQFWASLLRPSRQWPTLSLAVEIILTCAILEGIRRLLARSFAAKLGALEIGNIGNQARKPFTGGMLGEARSSFDPHESDPALLKKHSTFQCYTTSVATYPSIRTFYRPHPQADKLPSKPTPLPLLVFVHGLGGGLAGFKAILTSLVNLAPCLGIDFPGCGRSAFSPTNWSAYTPGALVELLHVMIDKYATPGQEVVLIGHSLGASLSALYPLSILPSPGQKSREIIGLVGICPPAEPPRGRKTLIFKLLLCVPSPIFNLWRAWDRRGGPNSASVARFVGPEANLEVKILQEKFNAQSCTPVYRRMAWGLLPRRDGSSGMASLDDWARLKIPIFLVGGDSDAVIKVDHIAKIARALGRADKPWPKQRFTDGLSNADAESENKTPEGNAESTDDTARTGSIKSNTETTLLGIKQPSNTNVLKDTSQYTHRRQVLKTSILPAPASHGLLYDPATFRILSGLIQTFLYEHVDTRLSLGWQLQHLSTEGKWDVKNLEKWRAVESVSEPIAGIFRAMKTLREVDGIHSPEKFADKWHGKIKAVIDISHESPVYDPKGLDDRGIEYHKFPTVSKIPPTAEETLDFAHLVDQLRCHPPSPIAPLAPPTTTSSSSPPTVAVPDRDTPPLIGVHCHYGFNRTGFFICSYLIQREHYPVQRAIDAFQAARPPGIRHAHFLDELFVRFCVGLKKAPTV